MFMAKVPLYTAKTLVMYRPLALGTASLVHKSSQTLFNKNYNQFRGVKNFAHVKSKRPPVGVLIYQLFIGGGLLFCVLDTSWFTIDRFKSWGSSIMKMLKIEAASALSEGSKKKSKKIEESEDSDQEVEENNHDEKSKKKGRPGFRDRKVNWFLATISFLLE